MSDLFPMPESLAEGRRLLAVEVPPIKRKQLGQCFTGLQTGRLLAALSVRHGQKRITDPMAGHGDLIESVAERASRLHLIPDEVVGVEIESEAARLGQWRVERCAQEFGFRQGRFIHGDAFDAATWNESYRFDLVITNPPYVRYQTLSKRAKVGGAKLLNAEATRRALAKLAVGLAPPEERPIWQQLILSYSGLADLSLPSWLLCGLLTAPSGILAMVVSQTWLNRDYARLARYFFLRFFQPLAIVQESGQRWFREALVPVSLVVGRRLTTEEAVIPLWKRLRAFKNTPFAEIDSAAGSENSHVGNSFAGEDPEGEFAKWLETGADSRVGIKLKRVSWESQRDEALAMAQGTDWLRQLEKDFSTGIVTVSSPTVALPPSIALLLPHAFLSNVRPLACESIRVGQGLRTGCNAFFYVEIAEDAETGNLVPALTSELFGRRRIMVPASVLKPILRRQAELSGMRIVLDALRGRMLDLRGLVLPENVRRNGALSLRDCSVMPEELADYVRLAARAYLIRGETRTLIPRLSAVKTNGLGPNEAGSSSLLFGEKTPRMWYMAPDFAPRHTPSLCVPRIIHDEPVAILNAEPPVLVDANFSTLWCEGDDWKAESVFAILNSTWSELCMESLGTTLGGGALKLEATHLRQLPIPVFSSSSKERLWSLAREALDSACTMNEFRHHRSKIDQVVISALLQRQVSVNETKEVVEKLAALIRTLRAKRRRNRNYKAQDGE